jgi:hypothetical protein
VCTTPSCSNTVHVLNYHPVRIKQRWRRRRKFAVKWKRHKGCINVHASGARCAATLDFISLLLAAMCMCCCVERARKDNLGRDAPIGRGGFCLCDIACKFSTQRSRLPVWEINNMRARSNNARCMFFVVISEREIQRNLHALLCRVNSINLSEWENE